MKKRISIIALFVLTGATISAVLLHSQQQHDLHFNRLDKGQHASALTSRDGVRLLTATDDLHYAIITDSYAWNSLWREIHSRTVPVPPAPVVRFEAASVLYVSIGPSGGSADLTVEEIKDRHEYIEILIERSIDSHRNPSIAVVTNPYQIVSLPIVHKPLRFTVRTKGE
jgi:hypothetical protein